MFGIMTRQDEEVLTFALSKSGFRCNSIRFLEIGVRDGQTARGVKQWCDNNAYKLNYLGIDNERDCEIKTPFDGADMIRKPSERAWMEIQHWRFNIILVDGCHCINHTILDWIHYWPLLDIGGYMMFHDTDPRSQGHHYQGHGEPHSPFFHIAVRAGIDKLRLHNRPGVRFVMEGMGNGEWGGSMLYTKTFDA